MAVGISLTLRKQTDRHHSALVREPQRPTQRASSYPSARSASHVSTSSAFTIIELLIVIVVVAILATIVVVAYNGIAQRAQASTAQSSAQQLVTKLQAYNVDNGAYPNQLSDAGINPNGGTTFQYTVNNSASPQTYCATVTNGSVSYYVDSGQHTTPTAGACAGQAPNGGTVITNLAVNPLSISSGPGIISNNPNLTPIETDVTIPTTPDGLTVGVESQIASGATTQDVLSVYNLDGLGNNSGVTRSISVWVYVNTSGYSVDATESSGFVTQAIPANTWIRLQTASPVGGTSWSGLQIGKPAGGGNATASDRAYITGVMSVTGNTPHSAFRDGNSTGWIWNGTPNNSTSTGPAL